MSNNSANSNTTVIPDGTDQALTSEKNGQLFLLEEGSAAAVAGAPLLTIDDPGVTFRNSGTAATTGETATVAIEANNATVFNFEEAEITAEDTAIEVDARQARINNAGLIDGGRNGIDFANGGESSGTFFNYGTVNSASRAVNIGGERVTIQNYGDIVGTGDQRNGTIYADGSADRYKIVNRSDATIDAGEGNQGAGISLQTGEEQGDVRRASVFNYGRIEGRGGAEDSSALAGDGIRIFSGAEEGGTTFRGDIVNHGEILSLDLFAEGATAAVRIADGVAFDGKIVNGSNGVIDGEANGIYLGEAEHDARIINHGLIQSFSRAVKIDGSDVTLSNYGRILGTGDQLDGTVHVDGSAEDVTIVNYSSGVIDGGEGNAESIGVGLEVGDEGDDIVDIHFVNHGTVAGRGGTPGEPLGSALYIFSEVTEGTPTYRGDIVNHGRITAEASDTITIDGVNVQGDLVNHGQIIAGGDGFGSTAIFVHASERDATFTGDIVNFDRIEADISGIDLDFGINFEGNIVNHGTIEADSIGIELSANTTFKGDITNHGTIAADQFGVFVDIGSSFTGNVTNFVTIDAGFDGIFFNVFSSLVGNVTNHGTIESGDDGIQFNGDNEVEGDIVNRGQIFAEDDGIDFNGGVSFDGDIVNSNLIEAEDDGIEINAPAAFTGRIINTGTITADADESGDGAALDADNVELDLTFVNRGVLNGDVVFGSGNDTFDGGNGSVNGTIVGGDGDDDIVSGRDDDFLVGDVIRRESLEILDDTGDVIAIESPPAGNDTLSGGAGNDTITGDVVELPSVGGIVFVGDDLIYGGEGDDRIAGDVLEYDETRLVGAFSDELPEGAVGVGFDTIHGGQGNDVISGDIFGTAAGGDGGQGGLPGLDENGDPIDGASGPDGRDGPRPATDTLFGGAGDDVIYGDASEDKRRGRLPEEVLEPLVDPDPDDSADIGFDGSPGQVGLSQDGGDSLYGGDGNDLLVGDVGRDILDRSSLGSDLLEGGTGNDTLIGDAGRDILDGSRGLDDLLYGGDGDDLIIGDAGRDIDATSQGGNDTVEGGDGADRIYGDAFGEDNGRGGDDSLDGGTGDDLIYGGSGEDVIDGGSGEDWIEGALGRDLLTGGAAADRFVFRAGDGGETLDRADLVTDFEDGTDLFGLLGGLVFGDGAGEASFVAADSAGLGGDAEDSALVVNDGNGGAAEVLAVIDNVTVDSLDSTDIFFGP